MLLLPPEQEMSSERDAEILGGGGPQREVRSRLLGCLHPRARDHQAGPRAQSRHGRERKPKACFV